MKVLALLLWVFVWICAAGLEAEVVDEPLPPEEVIELFESFRAGGDDQAVSANFERLRAAGTEKLPYLFRQLGRRQKANQPVFQSSSMEPPTMGDVAMLLIRGMFVDPIPKGYMGYEPFDKTTVENWVMIRAKAGKSVAQVRLEAAEYSLAKAEKEHADEFDSEVVAFFQERVDRLKAELESDQNEDPAGGESMGNDPIEGGETTSPKTGK
ncbi:hypothetical protein JIN81_15255 [Haloferula rosea]|uniref:Uncharacterized protein n=1 Tax=Haloferula rosea TaxID=490093 RepID=A0A934RB08_9BACT|nr:hypothetical protein [Haloferula rosea]